MKLGAPPPVTHHAAARAAARGNALASPAANRPAAPQHAPVAANVATVATVASGAEPSWRPPSKNPAAARELVGHTLELGVSLEGDVEKKIQDAELARGKTVDARVSAADMERAARFEEQATLMTPARQRDLFGFTRVVDAKVALTPATLELLAERTGEPAALKRAVDVGPPAGRGDGITWSHPHTPVELVASLVRQLALGAGASKQIAVDPPLAAWVDEALASGGVEMKRAMGGAGAFAANLASAVGVDAAFFSADPVPQAIAERFAPGVKMMSKAGEAKAAAEFSSEAPARVNASLEYGAGEAFRLLGDERVVVNGAAVALAPGGSGRVILGSKAKDIKPGFAGVDDKTLGAIAKDRDLFFFVGAHYLTQGSADESRAEAAELGRALDVMKAANPKLLRHAQYVVPKVHDNEPVVWGALKGKIDSLALNSVEVAPFVDSLFDGGLSRIDIDPHLPKEAAEDPVHMLDGALAIAEALDLKRVGLHGMEGDLVMSKPGTPGADDPNRQRQALVKARQLASNKTANDSGEIKSVDDIWPVVPSVRGSGLAALHRFADAVEHRFHLSDAERDLILERWWFRTPDGTTIHFVPSRGIHDRTGGTVSLGDTIDSTALIFALEPQRAPAIKHPSSFA